MIARKKRKGKKRKKETIVSNTKLNKTKKGIFVEFDESVSIWQKSRGKKYLRSFRMRTEMMTRRKMMTKMRR